MKVISDIMLNKNMYILYYKIFWEKVFPTWIKDTDMIDIELSLITSAQGLHIVSPLHAERESIYFSKMFCLFSPNTYDNV